MTFEKGAHLFNVDDICNYMLIITEGTVEITTMMDNGTEMVIERLMQGSSINGQAFLVQDNLDVVARCMTKTTLYMLETSKFFEVLSKYPESSEKIQHEIVEQIGKRENAIALDYIPGKTTYLYKGEQMKDEDALHIQSLILKLKNAIMYYIVRGRELRKVPKLKDILE